MRCGNFGCLRNDGKHPGNQSRAKVLSAQYPESLLNSPAGLGPRARYRHHQSRLPGGGCGARQFGVRDGRYLGMAVANLVAPLTSTAWCHGRAGSLRCSVA